MKVLNFTKSNYIEIPTFTDKQAQKLKISSKGWSYSYIYFFRELRDVYLLLKDLKYKSIKDITLKCKEKIEPEKNKWTERKVLEQINALKNFGLINNDYIPIKRVFFNSNIGKPLSFEDYNVFEEIFFGYFRFNQIHSWFLGPEYIKSIRKKTKIGKDRLIKNSKPLFYFSKESRFTDTFFYELKNNTDLYFLDKNKTSNNEDMMRFWDVFLKWGQELLQIERYNLKDLDINIINLDKSASFIYFVNNDFKNFDLFKFLKQNFSFNYISTADIVFKIALLYRYRIEDIKKYIIKELVKKRNSIDLHRTSEIFIRKNEKSFVPKYKDYFISHILIKI